MFTYRCPSCKKKSMKFGHNGTFYEKNITCPYCGHKANLKEAHDDTRYDKHTGAGLQNTNKR